MLRRSQHTKTIWLPQTVYFVKNLRRNLKLFGTLMGEEGGGHLSEVARKKVESLFVDK